MNNNAPDLGGFSLNDASILITGGTGSFGQEFVEYVIENFTPRRLIIFSRDELKQYEMAQKFPPGKHQFLRYFIGDVRDFQRLDTALRDVDLVIHAAAMKHVTIAEYNPFECIHTNVLGAENIVRAAIRNDVKKVVSLSTDKAANPVNLYGASKLAAEKIFVAGNNMGGRIGTIFSVVRYGNVAGSRGSVIPYFRKLIAEGATELPITDIRMTRFWITVRQGVHCVLWTAAHMQGGELVIPKIPSIKVTDLASAIGGELKHKVIGIRPGEKLHEVLMTEEEAWYALELDDYYIVEPTIAAQSASSTSSTWLENRTDVLEGPRVPDGFVYASNTNPDWLDADEILSLVP